MRQKQMLYMRRIDVLYNARLVDILYNTCVKVFSIIAAPNFKINSVQK